MFSCVVADDDCLPGLIAMLSEVINGWLSGPDISDASRKLLTTCTLAGIDQKYQKAGSVRGVLPRGIRQIAISEAMYRLAAVYALSLCEVNLPVPVGTGTNTICSVVAVCK